MVLTKVPAKIFFATLCAFLISGCTRAGSTSTDDGNDSPPSPPIDFTQLAIENNTRNNLAAIFSLTTDSDCQVYIQYQTSGFDRIYSTPTTGATSGVRIKIPVLGLHENRSYIMQAIAGRPGETARYRSEPQVFKTGAAPADLARPVEAFNPTAATEPSTEVFCFKQHQYQACYARSGAPVWYLRPADEFRIGLESRRLSDGRLLLQSYEHDRILVAEPGGEMGQFLSIDQLQLQSAYPHNRFHHDMIELTDGRFKGAFAFLTTVADTVIFPPADPGLIDDPLYLGYPLFGATAPISQYVIGVGIAVWSATTNTLLWEWSIHGEGGDSVSAYPNQLPYTRRGLGAGAELMIDGRNTDWIHANAIVHESDADDEFFWISLRHQDWIIKLDLDGNILWRLGYKGDFRLVGVDQAGNKVDLPDDKWFFHQHAPEIKRTASGIYDLLLYDNGNTRPVDYNYRGAEYSRVMRLELDENKMEARFIFELNGGAPEFPFYGWAYGDVDRTPDNSSFIFTTGNPRLKASHPQIAEVDFFGRKLWSLTLTEPAYRVEYSPDIYRMNWKYTAEWR